jgi:hypothetical protein
MDRRAGSRAAAHRMHEFVLRDIASTHVAFDELERAALTSGLPAREIESTIRSALQRAA